MSFRDIGVITHKVKAEVKRDAGHTAEQETDNNEPKSRESQAFKLVSKGKTLVEVVIALDLPADEVRVIFREFWELEHMHKLNEVYEEIKGSLPSFLKLHKIVKEQGCPDLKELFLKILFISC
jgi:hypothetical protein